MVGEGWVDGSRWTEWEEQVVELLEKKNVDYKLDDGWLAKRMEPLCLLCNREQ